MFVRTCAQLRELATTGLKSGGGGENTEFLEHSPGSVVRSQRQARPLFWPGGVGGSVASLPVSHARH